MEAYGGFSGLKNWHVHYVTGLVSASTSFFLFSIIGQTVLHTGCAQNLANDLMKMIKSNIQESSAECSC